MSWILEQKIVLKHMMEGQSNRGEKKDLEDRLRSAINNSSRRRLKRMHRNYI